MYDEIALSLTSTVFNLHRIWLINPSTLLQLGHMHIPMLSLNDTVYIINNFYIIYSQNNVKIKVTTSHNQIKF